MKQYIEVTLKENNVLATIFTDSIASFTPSVGEDSDTRITLKNGEDIITNEDYNDIKEKIFGKNEDTDWTVEVI